MAMAAFKPGWVNRTRCKATKRDGTPCRRLAMTKFGLAICGAHGGYAATARMGLRKPSRKYLIWGDYYRLRRQGKVDRP
jgi:hypothetical protein